MPDIDFPPSPQIGDLFPVTGSTRWRYAGSGVWRSAAATVGVAGESAAVSDAAYDSTLWDGINLVAPSKNAVRDKIELLDAGKQPISAVLTNTTASFTVASAAKLASLSATVGTTGDAYAASHEADMTAHPASSIVNIPAGNISATNVQSAINELDAVKLRAPLERTSAPVSGSMGVAASSIVSFSDRPPVGSHVVIGGRSYTYRDASTTPTTDTISRGYTAAAEAMSNTASAINGNAFCTPNAYVTAATSGAGLVDGQMRLTAKVAGAAGNSIAAYADDNHVITDAFTGGTDAIGTFGTLGQLCITTIGGVITTYRCARVDPALWVAQDIGRASDLTSTPSGGISSTNVQAAINELDAEKQPINGALTAYANAADAAARRTLLGLGTVAVKDTGTADGNVPARETGGGIKSPNLQAVNQDYIDIKNIDGTAILSVGVGAYKSGIASNGCTASGSQSFAVGNLTTADANNAHAEGQASHAGGVASHAEGASTTASGAASHAEGSGTTAQAMNSHAEGFQSLASGPSSHAEGFQSLASGLSSHAEGYGTKATESYSHAEGYNTTASGSISHAEGYNTIASGGQSHAEGISTTAAGQGSHADGYTSLANAQLSHASGSRARSMHSSARVCTDGQDADCESIATNSLTYRFQNGYRFLGGAAAFSGDVTANNLSGTNTGNQTAATTPNTPAGNIAAVNVQAAIDELDAEKQALLVSGTNVKTVNSQSIIGSGNLVIASGSSIVDTTHAALVTLRNAGTLIPGQRYRITDFVTKYARPKWTGTANVWTEEVATSSIAEPIVVVAIAANKIGTQALTELYPQDVLVYDIDSVTFTVNTANTGTRKGYIVRRTDTKRNNSLPYDYRHMKWNRYKADQTYFPSFETYNVSGAGRVIGGLFTNSGGLYAATVAGVTNARDNNPIGLVNDIADKYWVGWGPDVNSVVGNGEEQAILPLAQPYAEKPFAAAFNNVNAVLRPTGIAVEFYTFSSILTGTPSNGADNVNDFIQGSFTATTSEAANTVMSTEEGGCYSNTFGDTLYCNTIDAQCNSNTVGPIFSYNLVGKYFAANTIGEYFCSNTVGSNFARNFVGGNCFKNIFGHVTIGSHFGYNTRLNMIGGQSFDNYCNNGLSYNYIGNNFSGNQFGRVAIYNLIADGFTDNIVKSSFSSNNIGSNCYSNIVGNYFYSNVIGNNCYTNNFGDGFGSNTITSDFYLNTFAYNFKNNTIGTQFNNNAVGNSLSYTTFGNNFRYNTIGSDITSITLTGSPTHVYAAYSCRITKDSGGTTRLSYINSSGVPTVVAPNA